jgi:hypothetical protein
MSTPEGLDDDSLRRFVDEYRARCLWFLRPSYYPTTIADWTRVLDSIERHGDREAFVRVARVRTWLSRRTSDASAAS